MTPNEFTEAVNRLSHLMTTNIPIINEKMALDATAMIKDRIINTGVNSKGSSLGSYSDKEIPLFFKKNGKTIAPFSSPLNNAGEKFFLSVIKENKARREKGDDARGISYKEWRDANNRPTDHVTLSFSGQTMKDIGVVKQIVSGTKIITTVGPKNTKVRKGGITTEKITEGLGERYGNFLEPNAEEEQKLATYLENQVQKLINESFGKH